MAILPVRNPARVRPHNRASALRGVTEMERGMHAADRGMREMECGVTAMDRVSHATEHGVTDAEHVMTETDRGRHAAEHGMTEMEHVMHDSDRGRHLAGRNGMLSPIALILDAS